MSTVDFLPFATGVGANVESQATYLADPTTASGFQTGVAQSQKLNKVWRQGAWWSAVIANFVSQQLSIDVLDDGNLSGAVTNFTNAIIEAVTSGGNAAGGLTSSVLNLAGSGGGGTKSASWTVDQIVASTSLTGTSYRGTTLTLNFNGGINGAGGMDTGGTPVSGDLAIYAIFNPTTVTWNTLGTTACHGATYTGSNMPAGFTASARLWVGKTDGSGNILIFTQVDNEVTITAILVLDALGSSSITSLSIASCVPAAAKTVGGLADAELSAVSSDAVVNLYSNNSGTLGGYRLGITQANAGFLSQHGTFAGLVVAAPATIYYSSTVSGGGSPPAEVQLFISNYTF